MWKVKFKSYQRNFNKYQNFYDIDANNFVEWEIRKFAYFHSNIWTLGQIPLKGDLLAISTVFNADILVLLTTILDLPFFILFEAEIWFLHSQLFVTEIWLSEYYILTILKVNFKSSQRNFIK